MAVKQSGAPVGLVVEASLVKKHCRVDHSHEDDLIAHYIAAAVAWLEKACDTVFLVTEFTSTARSFELSLRKFPEPAIASINYVDELGATITLPATEYEIVDDALVVKTDPLPLTTDVTVVFTSGLGAGNIPADITQAALLLAASFYEERAQVTDYVTANVPWGVRQLIAPFRSFAH